jgi:hypothetical protein
MKLVRAVFRTFPGETVAHAVGLLFVLLLVAVLVWTFGFNDVPEEIPEYALGSALVYRLELAAAAILLLAIPAVVIGQLLAGRLPKSIGKDGVDWGDFAGAELERADELEAALKELRGVVAGLVQSERERRDRVDDLERRVKGLGG